MGGEAPPYKENTKCNVARKSAKRNGAIIHAKARRISPTLSLAPFFFIVSGLTGKVDYKIYPEHLKEKAKPKALSKRNLGI